MRECVDYLQNPEVLIQEFVDAYTAVESCCDPDEHAFRALAPAADDPRSRKLVLERLFAASPVTVFDTVPFEFTCLARDVASVSGSTGQPQPRLDGLDYVGHMVDAEPVGVLGVVQYADETTPYALFLRLITCLSEIAPEALLRAADETLFKGGLGPEPKLDLQMLLREAESDPAPGDAAPADARPRRSLLRRHLRGVAVPRRAAEHRVPAAGAGRLRRAARSSSGASSAASLPVGSLKRENAAV